MTHNLNDLEQVLPKLAERDRGFAEDLIYKGRRYGLSAKQAYWVDTLCERAEHPQPEQTKVAIAFEGIAALFDRAAGHLKYPKIHLQTPSGQPVVLARAGERSKAPGSITVTDGGSYGNNRYYGRIQKDGVYEQSFRTFPESGEVIEVLKSLAEDPVKVASAHGHLTGNCCFCNSALTDDRSTQVGYGPVCAKNYGLPWGAKAAVVH